MVGPCSTNGDKRNIYKLLEGNPEGKRPLGRPGRLWVDNIKMDLGEVIWGGVDKIGLTQDRDSKVENSCECGNEPSGSTKCWYLLEWLPSGGLSSCAQLHRVCQLEGCDEMDE
jgi:hypothetical protein